MTKFLDIVEINEEKILLQTNTINNVRYIDNF